MLNQDRSSSAASVGVGLEDRRIDNLCPSLRRYLRTGLKVLDVGCGPGAITMDVAREVHPGTVTGIDIREARVTDARRVATEENLTSISFEVGDAQSLRFADDSFDLAYSTHLLEWIRDPVAVLLELRRVVRPGGWVLAAMLDIGATMFYPACPTVEHIYRSWSFLKDSPDDHIFANPALGREAFRLFSEAGLVSIAIEVYGASMYTALANDAERFKGKYVQTKHHMSPEHPRFRELERLGVVDRALAMDAQKELDRWKDDPHAFQMVGVGVLGVGQV